MVSVSDASAANNAAADDAQHSSVGACVGSDDAELQPSSEHVLSAEILPKCKCCVVLVHATEEVVVVRDGVRYIDGDGFGDQGLATPCSYRALELHGRLLHGHHHGHLADLLHPCTERRRTVCSSHVVGNVGSKAHAART